MQKNPNTILIFEKPELYFFPHYQGQVFAPFDISHSNPAYFLYKLLYLLHLPCSCFWGAWKQQLRHAQKVIIFDYGYQRGMEKYIHRINPQCRVYLFLWNKIDKVHKNHTLYSDRDFIYSTDPGDCRSYGLKYNHIFYPMEYRMPPAPAYSHRLFFLGQDKNRGPEILALRQLLTACGLECDIPLLTRRKEPEYLKQIAPILTTTGLDYTGYLEEVQKCGVLLDIVQSGQQALTMRVLEALFLSRKLITNNPQVKEQAFYHPDNIFLLPPNWQKTDIGSDLKAFIQKPFVPYSQEVLEQYSYHHWVDGFQ